MRLDNKEIPENHKPENEPGIMAEGLNNASETENSLKKMPKAKYGYSLICLIIVAVVAAVNVIALNINSAYIYVSVFFSDITYGYNPDGSPFDIYELMSDEVLKSACDKLDNKTDPQTLKKHLSVSGITTDTIFNTLKQNVLDGNDTYSYFPSRYRISYRVVSDSISQEGTLAAVKAVLRQFIMPSKSEILQCVAESYKEYYETNYVITSDLIFDIDWSQTKSLDYFNRASEMTNILNRMGRYTQMRYDNDVMFVSNDGVSFGDLNSEISGIIQNDIEAYKSFVIQNGITSDRNRLLRQFRYVLNTNNEQAARSRGEYEIMLDGISIYDPNVTKVVFIPSLDSKNDFYMNRTKIGIDYLTENANEANLTGDEAENNAHYYEYLINQFGSTADSEEWILKAADEKCDEIISKLNDLCERASAVNNEFLNEYSYKGVELGSISLGEGLVSSVVRAVKMTIIWSSVLYVLWVAYSVLQKKKRARKEEQRTDVNS